MSRKKTEKPKNQCEKSLSKGNNTSLKEIEVDPNIQEEGRETNKCLMKKSTP